MEMSLVGEQGSSCYEGICSDISTRYEPEVLHEMVLSDS